MSVAGRLVRPLPIDVKINWVAEVTRAQKRARASAVAMFYQSTQG